MVFACSKETPDFGGVFMQSEETQQVLVVSAMQTGGRQISMVSAGS
jgi:hypothetical protein